MTQSFPPTRSIAALEQGLREGLHVGAQAHVSLLDRGNAGIAIGEARPGVAMRPNTIMLWMSATKPIGAVAFAILWERGFVAPDDRVASVIPEFGLNGKEAITFFHLLTHTAGIRYFDSRLRVAPWEERIRWICSAKIELRWIPGEKAGYHLSTTWHILAEAIRRLDGRPFDIFVRQEIFEPLGMNDCRIGMPSDRATSLGDRLGLMLDTSASLAPGAKVQSGSGLPPIHPPLPAGQTPLQLETHNSAKSFHSATFPLRERPGEGESPADPGSDGPSRLFPVPQESPLARVNYDPGAHGYGPASQLARFYEMLLRGGEIDGNRVLSPVAVEALTSRRRVGMFDHTFQHVMDWGLGFIVNSDGKDSNAATSPLRERIGEGGSSTERRSRTRSAPYGYGPHASPRTFGHGGYQSTTAFADPDHGLVAALFCNGAPGEKAHDQRLRAFCAAVYEDLGLVPPT